MFQHMDIFLFNYVRSFRHNENGFSHISMFCGCVKGHGPVWKNESRCGCNGFAGAEAISLEKTTLRFFFCVADVFASAVFAAKAPQTLVHVFVAISSPLVYRFFW